MTKKIDWLSILIISLLCIVAISGVLSMNFNNSYDVINQYGDVVKIYGSGIYASDSYFKAPISIGTDFAVLLLLVPLMIINTIQSFKIHSTANMLKKFSLYTVALYYISSYSFGVKYNELHLVYILLFTCSLFGVFFLARKIDRTDLKFQATKGINTFIIICGIALIVAWMPDIIPSLISGSSLSLIEVYTTEITYVLDMGIIAPLCFICLILLKKKDSLGVIILAAILQLCFFVGIMIIPQSICQIISGANIPMPVILTKGASFVVLGGFAYYFNQRIYKRL